VSKKQVAAILLFENKLNYKHSISHGTKFTSFFR